MIDRRTREVVGEFSSFCRPELNPVLSPFCTALTGITQAQVDAAPTFPEVLVTVEKWLSSLGIGDRADGLEPFHLGMCVPARACTASLTLQSLLLTMTFMIYKRCLMITTLTVLD